MNKIIFFDFDGVLVDSVKEAYAVAHMAFYGKAPDFKSTKYEIFRKYRYLIGPAWNYYYLLKVIESKKVESEYSFLLGNAKRNEYEVFERKYFKTRELLKNEDINFYLSYQQPYEFATKVAELVNTLEITPVIVTTKDEKTVYQLLDAYSLKELSNTIYGKNEYDKYFSKASIIKKHLSELIGGYNALFVDDLTRYLRECEDIGSLDLIQAGWGYVDPYNLYSHNKNCDEMIAYILNKFGG